MYMNALILSPHPTTREPIIKHLPAHHWIQRRETSEKTGVVRERGKVERSSTIFPSGGAAGANTQKWENPDLCRTQ